MIKFQFDFEINEGSINSFLIGSKKLFEKFYILEELLANSIDIKIGLNHKLIELEGNKISYLLDIEIIYPLQNVLGNNLTKEQVDKWLVDGFKILMTEKDILTAIKKIHELALHLSFTTYFLYVKIPDNYLKKCLEDIENLSILLFNNLVFFEL